MTARDQPHGTGVACQRIEVEGDLDAGNALSVVAIGMPARVSDVEVAVTAGIVEIVAQQSGGDVVDPRVIEQAAEILALIAKGTMQERAWPSWGSP